MLCLALFGVPRCTRNEEVTYKGGQSRPFCQLCAGLKLRINGVATFSTQILCVFSGTYQFNKSIKNGLFGSEVETPGRVRFQPLVTIQWAYKRSQCPYRWAPDCDNLLIM